MLKFFKERLTKLQGKSTCGFTHVLIETIDACTNNCYMCPNYDKTPTRGVMSDETFELIISKLKEVSFSGELHLYAQNEPFIDKKIIDKIYYANQELPNSKIVLISNFTILNDDLIDKILDAPIYNFSCSLYALDKENYLEICKKDNFEKSFINQVKFLKKYALKIPYSYANYIIHTPAAMKDMDFITNYIFNIAPLSFAQEGKVAPIFSSVHDKLKQSNLYYSDCVYTRLRFSENGDMSSCPCDIKGILNIGNIYDINVSLLDAYNSKKARELRKRMFSFDTKNRQNACQYCAFRRSENIFEFLFGKKINENDKYNHKLRTQRNSNEQIQNKLTKFNEIFKDGEEDKWLGALENLRKEFYAKHNA